VHIQGGEVSGSIDESARHAISKFAHFHFPSTKRSAKYLIRMGEAPAAILGTGCPSSDIAKRMEGEISSDVINQTGSGAHIDLSKPCMLAIFHPTTTEYGGEIPQMQEMLGGLDQVRIPTIFLWPNIDAGSDRISKALRVFRDHNAPPWLRMITNLAPEMYMALLRKVHCAVGNSSSFVRDASYFGTPVVLVGDRQHGREHDLHVMTVAPNATEIASATLSQLRHGRYEPSQLYGDGQVSGRIAERLAALTPYVQKRLHYIYDSDGVLAGADYASSRNHYGPGRVERDPKQEPRAAVG